MPRNGQGTYSVVNSFTPVTNISASAVNANFADVGIELTNSLPRDGQAGMLGQLKAADGTLALPGIASAADPDTGLHRIAADTWVAISGGLEIFRWSPAGLILAAGKKLFAGDASNQLIPTGATIDYEGATEPNGWLLCSGKTIGSATSGGTSRANADTEALFTLLWNSKADAEAPVSGGRGASAAADFAANKTIALPDRRGRIGVGKDNMGGVAAGRVTSGGSGIDAAVLGKAGGAETHVLTAGQMPSHTHPGSVTDAQGSHTHTITHPSGSGITAGGTNSWSGGAFADAGAISAAGVHSHNVLLAEDGDGAAHNNMPPAYVSNVLIKL